MERFVYVKLISLKSKLLLLCLVSLLFVNVIGNDIKSFQVLKLAANDSFLCATDTPPASVSIEDVIVGIPLGVPDAVRCGFLCSGFSNCSSYNYVVKQTTTYCDLYTFIPRNCIATTTYTCQHFQIPRLQGSCTPVCDPNCVSECVKQGAGKCDSKCVSGMRLLTSKNTCTSSQLGAVLGCIVDTVYQSTLPLLQRTDLTQQKCMNFCLGKEFPYAALLGPYHCSCIRDFATSAKSTACTLLCSGANTQKCGGQGAITVVDARP